MITGVVPLSTTLTNVYRILQSDFGYSQNDFDRYYISTRGDINIDEVYKMYQDYEMIYETQLELLGSSFPEAIELLDQRLKP